MADTERKVHKTDPSKVQTGDVMAIITYVKVKTVAPDKKSLLITDLDNGSGDISMQGAELIRNALSADRYEEEVQVGKLEAAEILITSHNRPLTVCFDKADGEERILRGRLVKHEALLGRSMVEDLENPNPKDRVRLVDHRTLKWLVVDGVKYVVAKR
jgi:hypothetical protein